MSFLLGQEYFLIPVFGILVFLISYLWADKLFIFIYNKTFSVSSEVVQMMESMLINVNKKKVFLGIFILSFGLGALIFLVLFPNVILGLIVGSVFVYLGWILPKIVMTSLFEKRSNIIVDDLVDGLTIMSNGIKAGLSVVQSMERVVLNMKGPLAQEFNLLLGKLRLGMSFEEGLNELAEKIRKQNIQMLVMAVNILKETGGNLSETFETMVTTIRERQKIEKKIKAMTAQGLTQGIIVTLVPFFLVVVFLIVDPGYIKPLFATPLGWGAIVLMLGLQVIGGVVMRKIVTIKV